MLHTSDGLSQLGQRAQAQPVDLAKTLRDGSRVAVVGAGPSGSMFSYFLLNMAVGGSFTGQLTNDQITAPMPAEMMVDYVRIYDNGIVKIKVKTYF